MEPFLDGGDMLREVTLDGASWHDLPWKFEAGTPPIAQGIGLAAAVTYWQELDMASVHAHEHALVGYALEQLQQVPDVEVYGPEADDSGRPPRRHAADANVGYGVRSRMPWSRSGNCSNGWPTV